MIPSIPDILVEVAMIELRQGLLWRPRGYISSRSAATSALSNVCKYQATATVLAAVAVISPQAPRSAAGCHTRHQIVTDPSLRPNPLHKSAVNRQNSRGFGTRQSNDPFKH